MGRTIQIRFPAEVRKGHFSVHLRIQTGYRIHPASYPKGTVDSYTGGKAPGA